MPNEGAAWPCVVCAHRGVLEAGVVRGGEREEGTPRERAQQRARQRRALARVRAAAHLWGRGF